MWSVAGEAVEPDPVRLPEKKEEKVAEPEPVVPAEPVKKPAPKSSKPKAKAETAEKKPADAKAAEKADKAAGENPEAEV